MLLRPTLVSSARGTCRSSYLSRPLRIATMPLRAKITNPEMLNQRSYATEQKIDSLPEDPENDVTFASKYGARIIELNRPEKLNSLNGSMIRKIVPRLQEWQKSDMANVVVIKGSGRAFCAGGDVAVLAQDCATGEEGQQRSRDYFALEYKLDHLIATYPKPYVAFIDGITMGGGVGLSVHAPFRIATERTMFAMPETTIGLFPDVGAGFFLPRMDGALGLYLALTSERLKGPEVFMAGVATHYLHSSSLPDVEARLAELKFKDYDSIQERLAIINNTIEEFTTGLPHDQSLFMDSKIRKVVDYAFQRAHDTPLKVVKALEQTLEQNIDDYIKEWAKKTLATIKERSPTSVAVAQQQYFRGARWNIAETFEQEHHIAGRFMAHPDFVTGVTARLISKEKGRPKWNPNTLEEVKDSQVAEFFADGRSPSELNLLNTSQGSDYRDYPYTWIGLPRESEVKAHVTSARPASKDEVVNYFLEDRNHKLGVREKVTEILDRQARAGANGTLEWVR